MGTQPIHLITMASQSNQSTALVANPILKAPNNLNASILLVVHKLQIRAGNTEAGGRAEEQPLCPHLLLHAGRGSGDLGLEPLAALLEEALLAAALADLHHVVLAPPPPLLRVHRHLVAVPPHLGPLARTQRHGWVRSAPSLCAYRSRSLQRSATVTRSQQNPSTASVAGDGGRGKEQGRERRKKKRETLGAGGKGS